MEALAEITAAVNNVPALRFPGFEGEWMKKKLKEIFTINAGGDVPKENVSEFKTDRYKYPIYANAEKNKGFYAYSDIYKVDKDVVTVAGRGVNVGIAHARNHKFYPIVRLLVLAPKSDQNIYFFEYAINRLNILIESTGVPQLTAPQLSGYKVAYPLVSEQQKIASFLSAADDKIQQLSKKKALLEKYKKGVMQKIFSQQIRFKDDNGNDFPEWEEKKLEELGKFIGGGTPSTKNNDYWSGNIPWISSSDLTDESIYKIRDTRFITKEAISESATKLIPAKSILIVSRVGVGKVAINEYELCTSQDFTSFIPKSDNYIFLAYAIKLKTNQLLGFNQGTSIKGFVKSDLDNLNISLPCLLEQDKIAALLTGIDNKIIYTSKQLEQAQQFKKGLLQQLFV